MDWETALFGNWHTIFRTLCVGALGYAVLVVFLRISGKRTLSKLNAFDLVVTISLGSTLSAILVQQSVTLAQGAAAFGLLILMQYLVTFLSVRSPSFGRAMRSEPTLLARDGEYCHKALQRERVMEAEALSAIRSAGGESVQDVAFLVLESDGSISAALKEGGKRMGPPEGVPS